MVKMRKTRNSLWETGEREGETSWWMDNRSWVISRTTLKIVELNWVHSWWRQSIESDGRTRALFSSRLKNYIMWNHFSIPKANYLNTQTFKKQIKWQTQLEISISLSPSTCLTLKVDIYIYIYANNQTTKQ